MSIRNGLAITSTILLLLCPLALVADEQTEQPEAGASPDVASYAAGYQMGRNIGQGGVDLDESALINGLRDGLAGEDSAYSDDEMRQALESLREEMMAVQRQRAAEAAKKAEEEGAAFLEENATRDEVTVLPSGLQYEVLQEGTGDSPEGSDRVKVHYRGTLPDGTQFDSSYDRGQPATFAIGGVIPGFSEGLQLMQEGAKYKLYVPADLGYGERPAGKIPPNSTLVFEVELLEIVEEEAGNVPEPSAPEADLPEDEEGASEGGTEMQETDEGDEDAG